MIFAIKRGVCFREFQVAICGRKVHYFAKCVLLPLLARTVFTSSLKVRNLYSSVRHFEVPRTCCLKRPIHSQLHCAILLCDVIPDGKTE